MDSHQMSGPHADHAPGCIAVVDEDGVSVLCLHGEIDSAAVAAWDEQAALTGTPPCVIDASDVTFLDARGLRLLVRETRAAQGSGCRPVLRRPTRVVRRVIDVTGTEELFTITS
jgi:anti-anti-sigma factor